jgi:serine/threonine protein kinase
LGYNLKGEKCAIKVIASNGLNSSIREKLLDEVKILKGLNHNNIIRLYDLYEDIGEIYIIMEYCEDTMSSLLNKKLTELEVKYYIKQLVDGLYYLQKRNIVHRDLKPANILLKNGIIKIADFGFAKLLNDVNPMMETICGSPLYMAPEILFKTKYSSKSDLWSLGVIIYQMIYQRHPYRNPKSIMDLVKKIEAEEIEYPIQVEVSREGINLMRELLEVSPTGRMTLNELKNHEWFIDVNLYENQTYLELSDNETNKTPGSNKTNGTSDIFRLDTSNNSIMEMGEADSQSEEMNEIIIDNYLEDINIRTKPISIVPRKNNLRSNLNNSIGSYGDKGIGSSLMGFFKKKNY